MKNSNQALKEEMDYDYIMKQSNLSLVKDEVQLSDNVDFKRTHNFLEDFGLSEQINREDFFEGFDKL